MKLLFSVLFSISMLISGIALAGVRVSCEIPTHGGVFWYKVEFENISLEAGEAKVFERDLTSGEWVERGLTPFAKRERFLDSCRTKCAGIEVLIAGGSFGMRDFGDFSDGREKFIGKAALKTDSENWNTVRSWHRTECKKIQ